MKVGLQSITATRNCCVAHVMQKITAEGKAAHGYVSHYDGSATGNNVKLKKYNYHCLKYQHIIHEGIIREKKIRKHWL